MVDELPAGGPIGDEVALAANLPARDSEDVEDGDGKGQAGDSGNRDFSEVAALMCWRKIQLAAMVAILRQRLGMAMGLIHGRLLSWEDGAKEL